MFSLVQGFYREVTHVPERPVILLGLSGAGKSSVLEWLKAHPSGIPDRGKLAKIAPTVGLNVTTLRLAFSPQRLLVWDLGGAEKLRPIWEPYLKQAEALVWCIDATGSGTDIEESRRVLADIVRRDRFQGRPLLVLANKSEARDALSTVDLALKLDIIAAADTRSQCIHSVSAKNGTGIREAFEWLDDKLRNPEQPDSYKTSIK